MLSGYAISLIVLIPLLIAIIYAIIKAIFDAKKKIKVVCSSCAPDLLAAKTRGIQEAMRRLEALIGEEGLPLNLQVWPLTFHLDGDSYCSQYQRGITGFLTAITTALGTCVCLTSKRKIGVFLSLLRTRRKLKINCFQCAMHGWFVGRQENYLINGTVLQVNLVHYFRVSWGARVL